MTPAQRVSKSVRMVAESAGYAGGALWTAWKWLLAPLCDSWDGLSLNRFIAILFAIAAVHGRLYHDQAIGWTDITMAVIAGSLSFGKDCFMIFLERWAKKDEA